MLSPGPEGLRAAGDVTIEWDPRGRITGITSGRESRDGVLDVRSIGLVVPGFVDAHVHFPQYQVRGRFGGALLPWLRDHIWPEEIRFADRFHAQREARVFLDALAAAGTTTAAVFGSPHPSSVVPLLEATDGPDVFAGPALMDREGPPELLTEPGEACKAMERLVGFYGDRLAVSPRFAVSSSPELLARCGQLARDHRLRIQTHLAENLDEIALVASQFPDCRDYLDVYERAGLIGPRSLLAHVVHCSDDALERIAAASAIVVHCPTSNIALGSGRMPIEVLDEHGIHICLGTDVGAGPDLCLLDVVRAFCEVHKGRYPIHAESLLRLATLQGALALGLADRGMLDVGFRADMVVLRAPDAAADPVRAFEVLARDYEGGASSVVERVFCAGRVEFPMD